jgi:hypothetical protein
MGGWEMATTTGTSRRFPTVSYMASPFRWFCGSRRRVWTAAAVLLAMIAVPPIWWSLQLVGLPDIGDPFDIAAFRSLTIPDDRNAYVLYRQAADLLKPASLAMPASQLDAMTRWSTTDPEFRRWVEENREAMILFRRGTERPDALLTTAADDPASHQVVSSLISFFPLALLEASRLEERGDMAGAWVWYRAALRATYHMGLRGSADARMYAHFWHGQLSNRLGAWASDPRTSAALVRQALDEVIACGTLTPSESYTLKAEYLLMESSLNGPDSAGRQALIARLNANLGPLANQLDTDQVRAIADAWRLWRREPERSRRVIRLAVANWLADDDLPPDRRPKSDLHVDGSLDFYAFGPEAPGPACALSPAALDRWLSTTIEVRPMFSGWARGAIRVREQVNHRSLVILLARQLYRREHGTDAPSAEALVGPYVKELPDGR